MGLRARILRSVSGACGPATKAVLRWLCRNEKQRGLFPEVFRELLSSGALVMIGTRKHATYGPARRRRN